MTVHSSCSMARYVFGTGKNATALQPSNKGCNMWTDCVRILPEGSGVYNRIVPIGVHIGHGSPVPVDAQGPHFPCNRRGDVFSDSGRCCTQGHGAREGNPTVPQSHRKPILVVCSEEQALGTMALQVADHGGRFGQRSRKESKGSNASINQGIGLLAVRGIVPLVGIQARHHKAGEARFYGHTH